MLFAHPLCEAPVRPPKDSQQRLGPETLCKEYESATSCYLHDNRSASHSRSIALKRTLNLLKSSLGTKAVVAVTGLVMLGFLVGHVVGNLKIFLPDFEGQPDIDRYAEFLRTAGEPMLPNSGVLWAARCVLLVSVILHVVFVIRLAAINRAARPQAYAKSKYSSATRPARWMMFTGLAVLAFIIFHLLHLTIGAIDPGKFVEGEVYANLHAAFQQLPLVGLYVLAMAVIMIHLCHGVWSLFQTLGLDNPDRNRLLRMFAVAISFALFVGFSAVPVSLYTGWLAAPKESVIEESVTDTSLELSAVVSSERFTEGQ